MKIGIAGTIGSGKGVLANYLSNQLDCEIYSFGNLVREVATAQKIEHTRENLQELGYRMRKNSGRPFWAEMMVKRILDKKSETCIIDGFRYPDQVEHFREKFPRDFHLIGVDAQPEKRFRNMFNRGRKDDPKTLLEFLAMDENDLTGYRIGIGQNTEGTLKLADRIIYNDDTLAELEKQARELLRTLEAK